MGPKFRVIQKNKLLQLRYCPQNVPSSIASRYLGQIHNPVLPKIAHMYQHRDRTTLWWSISSNRLLDYKRVVRSWSARRVKTAFRESLRRRGFDDQGREVVLDSLGKVVQTTQGCTGTLELFVLPRVIKESFEEIQKVADEAVDTLIIASEKNSLPTKKTRETRQKRPSKEGVLGKKEH